MSKKEKIVFAISGIIAVGCAVLNIMTDYIHRYPVFEFLMIASYAQVVVFLNELAKKSRKKDKDSN
jgi:hypothetical protein